MVGWPGSLVWGQLQSTDTRSQLESQRKDLLRQIDETQNELSLLRNNKKVTINQLKVLQDELAERQKLIDNIHDEIKYIDGLVWTYNNQIAGLRRRLADYKRMYSQSLRYAYKSRNNLSMLAYMCSAADFNDAVRRMRYLHLMRAMRHQQADKIRATHAELYHKLDLLNAEKANRNKLLADLDQQNNVLAGETKDANAAYHDMSGKEKELQTELLEKKKSAKRINDAIESIIKQEMRHSEDLAAGGKPKKTEDDESSEEESVVHKPKPDALPSISKQELNLARTFELNRGKLGWPVDKGTISGHFGKYSIKNIDYFNNGVDIHTVSFGIVNSVFEGVVSSVVVMDGKTIVIIQHGNYFTVYNNLLRAMVLKGQHVITKQPLGLVANNEDGIPTLNFQVWKSVGSKGTTAVLDPEAWIGKVKR